MTGVMSDNVKASVHTANSCVQANPGPLYGSQAVILVYFRSRRKLQYRSAFLVSEHPWLSAGMRQKAVRHTQVIVCWRGGIQKGW